MHVHGTLSRRLVSALCVATLSFAPASAQHVTASLGLSGGVPHEDFREHQARVGFGVSGLLLYGIGPVAAGVELGWLTYDRQSAPMDPALDAQSAFVGDVTTASGIGHVHAVLRLKLPEGPFRPYVDGLAGFQRFRTTTVYEQNVVVGGGSLFRPAEHYRQRTHTTDADDTALSYGVGAGVLVRLAAGVDGKLPYEAFLDLGARYIRGQEATYIAVAPDGTFHRVRSRTDMLRPQVSLVIVFGR